MPEIVRCVGDGEGGHVEDCSGVATHVVIQTEECPPGCEHPLSPECVADLLDSDNAALFKITRRI